MNKTDKTIDKQKQLFYKMSPKVLSDYCELHPRYSLPAGVRNQRTKDALDSMEFCAQQYLSTRVRQILAVYMEETFSIGRINVKPKMLNTFYAPVLEQPTFEKEPLQQAIGAFLEFSKTPMTPERKEYIHKFAKHIIADDPQAAPRPLPSQRSAVRG